MKRLSGLDLTLLSRARVREPWGVGMTALDAHARGRPRRSTGAAARPGRRWSRCRRRARSSACARCRSARPAHWTPASSRWSRCRSATPCGCRADLQLALIRITLRGRRRVRGRQRRHRAPRDDAAARAGRRRRAPGRAATTRRRCAACARRRDRRAVAVVRAHAHQHRREPGPDPAARLLGQPDRAAEPRPLSRGRAARRSASRRRAAGRRPDARGRGRSCST